MGNDKFEDWNDFGTGSTIPIKKNKRVEKQVSDFEEIQTESDDFDIEIEGFENELEKKADESKENELFESNVQPRIKIKQQKTREKLPILEILKKHLLVILLGVSILISFISMGMVCKLRSELSGYRFFNGILENLKNLGTSQGYLNNDGTINTAKIGEEISKRLAGSNSSNGIEYNSNVGSDIESTTESGIDTNSEKKKASGLVTLRPIDNEEDYDYYLLHPLDTSNAGFTLAGNTFTFEGSDIPFYLPSTENCIIYITDYDDVVNVYKFYVDGDVNDLTEYVWSSENITLTVAEAGEPTEEVKSFTDITKNGNLKVEKTIKTYHMKVTGFGEDTK